MMTNSTNPCQPYLIEKELIGSLKFPSNDVLTTLDDKTTRTNNLERALKLGNLEHNKIRVVFEDSEGMKQVETTIWGVTDKRIILKQGTLIPIHRIHEVRV